MAALSVGAMLFKLAGPAAGANELTVKRGDTVSADQGAPASRTVQGAAQGVYRLLVEIDGAIKGGTAFLVSGKRIVATNHHVIEQGHSYSVGYLGENGRISRVPLRVLAVFPQKDLALLEALDDLPGEPLPLAGGYPSLATDIVAIGFPAAADPQGLSSWTQGDDETFFLPSVLKGYVSRVLTNRWFSSQLQHQTPIIPGYSGGPLIDKDGTVLAVSSSIHKEASGISYGVLAVDLGALIAACALPARIVNTGGTLRNTQRKAGDTMDTANTHAMQEKLKPDPADEAMLQRGHEFLARGDIEAARLMFRYLVTRRGMAAAYNGLAKTYDPYFLSHMKVVGVLGDANKAQELYEKAASLSGAGMPHERVYAHAVKKNGGCDGSVCKLANSMGDPVVICEKAGDTGTEKSLSRR
ncbi:MAG: trypsin-like peptidase domain-containing protein [Rhodomicrobium sp.]|nr:trypsin-like peptidase domain-containing protein [Rhodomicrobium sp.]